jgi:hypothetical protein
VIGESGFHRGRNPQRLMHTAEIVIRVVDRHMVAVILEFLGEGICQAREAPNAGVPGLAQSECDTSLLKPRSIYKTAYPPRLKTYSTQDTATLELL